MEKMSFEEPPPGLGFTAVTTTVRGNSISRAEMVAVSWLPLTKIVGRGLPFHLTTEPGTKPVPFTVSVKSGPPGATAVGTSGWLTNGTGLGGSLAAQ